VGTKSVVEDRLVYNVTLRGPGLLWNQYENSELDFTLGFVYMLVVFLHSCLGFALFLIVPGSYV